MCGGRVDVWWFRFGCVVVFFVGWIWIYGTWVFGVDLWWLLEKIFDVVVLESRFWMCGGRVDVWWFGFGCAVVFFVGWILNFDIWHLDFWCGSVVVAVVCRGFGLFS